MLTATQIEKFTEAAQNAKTSAEFERLYNILNTLRGNASALKVLSFAVGDRVSFKHKGKSNLGTVIKVNKKTVKVKTDEIGVWNVGGSHLTRV